jgi:hypothetical protein
MHGQAANDSTVRQAQLIIARMMLWTSCRKSVADGSVGQGGGAGDKSGGARAIDAQSFGTPTGTGTVSASCTDGVPAAAIGDIEPCVAARAVFFAGGEALVSAARFAPAR